MVKFYRKKFTRKSNKYGIRRRKIGKGDGTYWTRRVLSYPGKPHFFKRTIMKEISINPTTGILHLANSGITDGTSAYFSLGDLVNVSEFSNLFDAYKINGVKIKFIFDKTSSLANSIAGAWAPMPNIYWVNDYDDGAPLTEVDDYVQYESFKTRRLNAPVSIYIKPVTTSTVFAGVTAGYMRNGSRWLDMAATDTQHYGIKYMIDPGESTIDAQIGNLKVFYTYYMAFKDVR